MSLFSATAKVTMPDLDAVDHLQLRRAECAQVVAHMVHPVLHVGVRGAVSRFAEVGGASEEVGDRVHVRQHDPTSRPQHTGELGLGQGGEFEPGGEELGMAFDPFVPVGDDAIVNAVVEFAWFENAW